MSGRDLLLALVLGQEVECRIGLAISPEPLQQRLAHHRDLRRVRRRRRLRQAACGSMPSRWCGRSASRDPGGRPVRMPRHAGKKRRRRQRRAQRAVVGAAGGERFCGPAEPLNGAQGYYNAMGETPDLAASPTVSAKAGRSWRRPTSRIRAASSSIRCSIACWTGGATHPAAAVAKVVVTGNPLLAARADRPDISTGRESQVSVQHAVAAALVTGKAGLDQFTDACVQRSRSCWRCAARSTCVRDASFATIAAGGRDHHRRRQDATSCRSRRRAAATPIR